MNLFNAPSFKSVCANLRKLDHVLNQTKVEWLSLAATFFAAADTDFLHPAHVFFPKASGWPLLETERMLASWSVELIHQA